MWNARFKDPGVHHLSSAPFDWRTDTLAVHWTYPDPKEFEDETSLLESTSMFASIGRYVLEKSEKELASDLSSGWSNVK